MSEKRKPYLEPHEALAEIGARVLAAEPRTGQWSEHVDGELIDREGLYWTVIDRDTGDQVGGFGFPVQMATREEALDEAWRFGSKWDWPVDREWRSPTEAQLLNRPPDLSDLLVCETWREQGDDGVLTGITRAGHPKSCPGPHWTVEAVAEHRICAVCDGHKRTCCAGPARSCRTCVECTTCDGTGSTTHQPTGAAS